MCKMSYETHTCSRSLMHRLTHTLTDTQVTWNNEGDNSINSAKSYTNYGSKSWLKCRASLWQSIVKYVHMIEHAVDCLQSFHFLNKISRWCGW